MQALNAPQLGTPVPGTTGGMPKLGGLSVGQNPMAQQLQSLGRGEDTMLVHMTPAEVNSLQGLAMATGGSLTINPHTGLPEAGWLGKLLPTLIGAGLSFIPGVGPLLAAGLTAAGTTAVTGDLKEGLMAGLGAYGGASLAGGITGAASGAAKAASDVAIQAPASLAGGAGSQSLAAGIGEKVAGQAAQEASKNLATQFGGKALSAAATTAASPAASGLGALGPTYVPGVPQVKTGLEGFMQGFGNAAKEGIKSPLLQKYAPAVAASGVMNSVSNAMTPDMPTYSPKEEKSNYAGPYVPDKREVSFQNPNQMRETGGAEYQYFTPSNPVPGYRPVSSLTAEERAKYGFADGGIAALPVPQGFNDAVNYFNAANPGAITASSLPTPAPTGEKTYNFKSQPDAPAAPTPTPTSGYGFDFSNIPGLSGFNFANLLAGYQPTAQSPDAGSYAPITPDSPPIPAWRDPGAQSSAAQAPQPSAGEQMYPFTYAPPVESPYMPSFASQYDNSQAAAGNPDDTIDPYRVRDFSTDNMDHRAKGGSVNMRDGSFVVDARTVSELGNGSSNAGIEALARMGGRPVQGPGDGVSDSVPANIGGKQEARVARDEVVFPPEAVRKLGGGNQQRGTQKLYDLMNKAHKARKKAQRGQDTGLRKGLM